MMNFSWLTKPRSRPARSGRDRRRADRMGTNALICDLGTVADISQTGMRLKCDRKPPVRLGQVFEAKLDSGMHRVPVCGQVKWIKRKGRKAYEIGVHFVNVKASLKAAIDSIGKYGFVDLDRAAQARQKKYAGSSSGNTTVRATATLPDYYSLLGVPQGASDEDIRHAFRSLAREYHPDVAATEEAAEKFVQITQAYEILRDPEARKTYDRRRAG